MFKTFIGFFSLLCIAYFFHQALLVPYLFEQNKAAYHQDLIDDYQGTFLLLQKLHPLVNTDEFDKLLDKVSMQSNTPVSLFTIETLPKSQLYFYQRSKGSAWVENYDNDLVYKEIQAGVIVRLGPLKTPENIQNVELLMEGITPVLLFAFITFIWVMQWQYGIRKLQYSANKFSQGDLAHRAGIGFWKVGQLNRAFNQMAKRLQRLINSHKQLTHSISHELRSPIGRVRFQLEVLDDDIDGKQKKQLITSISEDLDDMEDMLNEMLTYANLERTEPYTQFRQQNFNVWLNKQIVHLSIEIMHKVQVETGISENSTCMMDAHLMARLLRNLVSNADRYCQHFISIGAKEDHNTLSFWVDDDGPGIPVEERSKILEPYRRLILTRENANSGFGLGLAIAQQIIRCHEGRLTIEDSPLGGARVKVSWSKYQKTIA